MMKKGWKKDENGGFTLVEVLVYMMLLGVAMTSIYAVFISNVKSHASQENAIEMVQDLRGSIDIMVREIRMAGYDPAGAGAGFTNNAVPDDDELERNDTDADSIHFTMDIDGSGATDGSNEDFTYYLDNTNKKIMRRTKVTSKKVFQPLAEKISGLVFQYYNASGTEIVNPTTTQLADIRSVLVTITGETEDVDPNTLQKKQRVISTRVRVRNAGL